MWASEYLKHNIIRDNKYRYKRRYSLLRFYIKKGSMNLSIHPTGKNR